MNLIDTFAGLTALECTEVADNYALEFAAWMEELPKTEKTLTDRLSLLREFKNLKGYE